MGVDLARTALRGLLTRTGVDPASLSSVIMGSVMQEVFTSNVSREAALSAGIPHAVPCHTVTQACISANAAIASAAQAIAAGRESAVIAGGTETMSDACIRFSRPLRKRLIKSGKAKGWGDYLSLLKGLKVADFAPVAPSISEFSTGETMGVSSDKLAAVWGVTREAQDDWAWRSHNAAAAATAAGRHKVDIIPLNGLDADNGIKGGMPREKLAGLKPAFVKPHGTHTAANSS